MKGSGRMSPMEKNRIDYVIFLTTLRDVFQTPRSFLPESLGVNQLTCQKKKKVVHLEIAVLDLSVECAC